MKLESLTQMDRFEHVEDNVRLHSPMLG